VTHMVPGRGRCLVRKVETEETFAGSKIILPEAVRDTLSAQQVELVAVGQPSACKAWEDCERWHDRQGDTRTHPFHGKPGDWVVIARRSLVESGQPDCYLIPQDDVLAILSAD
jgi:hypothetical protein